MVEIGQYVADLTDQLVVLVQVAERVGCDQWRDENEKEYVQREQKLVDLVVLFGSALGGTVVEVAVLRAGVVAIARHAQSGLLGTGRLDVFGAAFAQLRVLTRVHFDELMRLIGLEGASFDLDLDETSRLACGTVELVGFVVVGVGNAACRCC